MQMLVTESRAADKPKKLLERVRDVIRVKHYSLRTERTYCDWIERFIRFHRMRHPSEMGAAEVGEFLTHLARDGNVSASTQNQALSALLFLLQTSLKGGDRVVGGCGAREKANASSGGAHTRRSSQSVRTFARHAAIDGRAALRKRAAPHGMCPAAGEGCRFRLCPDYGARWQRREG